MCYTVAYLTKRKITYARRAGADEAEIRELEERLEEITTGQPPMFHVSGFTHPKLLCFHRDDGPRFELLRWGLIPHWVKDHAQAAELSRRTLNARGETLFEKPAFREAAKHRCLVLVDGFFEFHHLGKRSFPYHIRARDGGPIALGGVRSIWRDPDTGELTGTVSIVTTVANVEMARIHNNAKADGPRMPFILPKAVDAAWLSPDTDAEHAAALIQPYADELLEQYTVPPLLGKQAIGNVPAALEPFPYMELL